MRNKTNVPSSPTAGKPVVGAGKTQYQEVASNSTGRLFACSALVRRCKFNDYLISPSVSVSLCPGVSWLDSLLERHPEKSSEIHQQIDKLLSEFLDKVEIETAIASTNLCAVLMDLISYERKSPNDLAHRQPLEAAGARKGKVE